VLALRARALTPGGAIAAFVVGTCTYTAGGWGFTLVLLAFFLPSVALSRVGRARHRQLGDIGKGGARDAWQVLANGGIATVCAIVAGIWGTITDRIALTPLGDFGSTTFVVIHGVSVGPFDIHDLLVTNADRAVWIAAFAGSYAAATADTWGTEIGTLVRGVPHSILTFRPVAPGLSGGITRAGTLAEIGGALWIAVVAGLSLPLLQRWPGFGHMPASARHLIAPVWIGGFAGALIDSILGATVQELRRCPACERTCETNPHVCGTPTLLVRGVRGFSNDAVNFAATLSGAVVAFAVAMAS
jgi:uncharacterized membrane protein